MKTNTIETLLPEFDRLTALRASTEEMKPRLEDEITEGLASGELDEKLASSLQTKRAQLELIPAKLAQIDKRLADIGDKIKSDFTERYAAFQRRAEEMRKAVEAEMRAALSPLLSPATDSRIALDVALERFLTPNSYLAHSLSTIKAVIDFPVSQGNFVQAARNLLESERTLENLPTRHAAAA